MKISNSVNFWASMYFNIKLAWSPCILTKWTKKTTCNGPSEVDLQSCKFGTSISTILNVTLTWSPPSKNTPPTQIKVFLDKCRNNFFCWHWIVAHTVNFRHWFRNYEGEKAFNLNSCEIYTAFPALNVNFLTHVNFGIWRRALAERRSAHLRFVCA